MARRPTTEELARQILRRIYEDTDGRPMEWRTLVTNKSADAAVELAVDYGWLLIDGDKGVCLSDEGRALVRLIHGSALVGLRIPNAPPGRRAARGFDRADSVWDTVGRSPRSSTTRLPCWARAVPLYRWRIGAGATIGCLRGRIGR